MWPHSRTIASKMFIIALGSAGIAEHTERAGVNFPDRKQVGGTNLALAI